MSTCCVLLGFLSAATASSPALRTKSQLLARTPQVEQHLVICNAYASPKALNIVHVRTLKSLTDKDPLHYKQCKEFTAPLQEGDQLDFKAGNLDVGTFYATGLPKSSASLLLVPRRRNAHAVGMKFESHAFAELTSPQIAVIDASVSSSAKMSDLVKITESVATNGDNSKAETPAVEEELAFNSVVAVNPGKYEISLASSSKGKASAAPLNALGSTKYVVMRIGGEDGGSEGKPYPEELIVYQPNHAAHIVSRLSASLLALIVCIGLRDTIIA